MIDNNIILLRHLNLNLSFSNLAVMYWRRCVIQRNPIMICRNHFANTANKMPVQRKMPAGEVMLQLVYNLAKATHPSMNRLTSG